MVKVRVELGSLDFMSNGQTIIETFQLQKKMQLSEFRPTYIAWYLCLSLSETDGPIEVAPSSKSNCVIVIPQTAWCLGTSELAW